MKLKKPKFWDDKTPSLFAYILYPVGVIIKLARSLLVIQNNNKSNIKTICIGNMYLGGTGKTSLSITINKILKKKKLKSCFIKKFYKSQIDEQKILENNGKLFLSFKRIDALKQAEDENFEIAIFDDGLQDKTINYDISFVCFNDINWIGNGMVIPSGPLREDINNLKNHNHVFLSGNLENIDNLIQQIKKINSNINIHLGKYEPTNIDEFKKNEKYLVFSGIGNHNTFISMIKINGLNVIKDIEFPDHYNYTNQDMDKIYKEANILDCKIITTEKDLQRIDNLYYNKIKIMKAELKIVDEDKLIKSII